MLAHQVETHDAIDGPEVAAHADDGSSAERFPAAFWVLEVRVPRIHNKSRRPKAIPLTPREALLLKEQLLARTAGTSLVFPNDKGGQWNRHRFRDELWQDAVEAAGYDSLPFHMLRHTAISLMCRAGYRPEWVAERVGHADGGALILKRYRHLYPSESYAAAPSLDALVAER